MICHLPDVLISALPDDDVHRIDVDFADTETGVATLTMSTEVVAILADALWARVRGLPDGHPEKLAAVHAALSAYRVHLLLSPIDDQARADVVLRSAT